MCTQNNTILRVFLKEQSIGNTVRYKLTANFQINEQIRFYMRKGDRTSPSGWKRCTETVLQDALQVLLQDVWSSEAGGNRVGFYSASQGVMGSFWLLTDAVKRKSRLCLSGLAVLYILFLQVDFNFTLLTENSPWIPFFSSSERIKLCKSAIDGPWAGRRRMDFEDKVHGWSTSWVSTSNWSPTKILQESH